MTINFATSPRYKARGDDTKITLLTGSQLTVSDAGLDVYTRPFECRTDLVRSFLPVVAADGVSDPLYPELVYSKHSVQDGAGWRSTITVEYAGLIGGMTRDADVNSERVLSTVQLSTDEEENVDVSYYGLQTTYRYSTETRPKAPRFVGATVVGPNVFSFFDPRPSTFKGKLKYQWIHQLKNMRDRQRGRHHEVEEVWGFVLQPPAGVNNTVLMSGSLPTAGGGVTR